jgi:PP-loop superfamily ATP-utilizing enzyme
METTEQNKPLRIISYGGGVQSTALIVLAVQGKIGHIDAALFSNVGDDSEHPATNSFVREVAIPWAAERGLEVIELTPMRKGKPTTIYSEMMNPETRRDVIPVFGEKGNPLSRICTADYKIGTIHRWLKQHGTSKNNPATVCLGISTDEIERAGRGVSKSFEIREYPLLDLNLNRTDCTQIIRDAGLPVPPKSSCFFCPFHSELVWSELRRDHPDLFWKAQEMEDAVQQRKKDQGMRQVYLTRKGANTQSRLSDTIHEAGETLFGSEIGVDGCDSGFCWT